MFLQHKASSLSRENNSLNSHIYKFNPDGKDKSNKSCFGRETKN